MALQAEDPPFGGFVPPDMLRGMRVFMSPGPIWEPQGPGPIRGALARALHAAGFKPGDTVVNTFAYHMTPGGFIMEEGARALGCPVIPGRPRQQRGAGRRDRGAEARGYLGTPDFLKILLDKAEETGRDVRH